MFCKILNNRLVEHLDRERALHEGQTGFRKNKSCIDNDYTLNEVVHVKKVIDSGYRYLGIDFACNGAWDVHV